MVHDFGLFQYRQHMTSPGHHIFRDSTSTTVMDYCNTACHMLLVNRVHRHVLFLSACAHYYQKVNPKLTLPYWDFTIEDYESRMSNHDGGFKITSPLFQESWFGSADPEDNVVSFILSPSHSLLLLCQGRALRAKMAGVASCLGPRHHLRRRCCRRRGRRKRAQQPG